MHSTLLWTACCFLTGLLPYCVCLVWVSPLRCCHPQIDPEIRSCCSVNVVCRTLLFVSSAGPVSLKPPSCRFKLQWCFLLPRRKWRMIRGLMLLQGKSGSGSLECIQEHHWCVPDFPGCHKICEASLYLWNKNRYIHTSMETNAGRRGGDSSWIAIIQHQRLILATEIAISCQLSGLCQWLWLCGDSKGEPAEPAHCILAERVSASKNTDAEGKSARSLSTRSPSKKWSQKKKARLQSWKKGQGGNYMATMFILQTPWASKKAAPRHKRRSRKCSLSLCLSHTHTCKIDKIWYFLI